MINVRIPWCNETFIQILDYRDADNERFHDASWDTDTIFAGQMLRILQRVSFFPVSS
jgi:hypothetical protein